MQELGLLKLIEGLCKCASENDALLRITQEEAKEVLSGLINEKILVERIRSIEINRKPYKIRNMQRFQKYFETMGHNGIIERICFDNSSKYAFTGGADGAIKCWSITDGMLIRTLYGHENMVSDLCINKNGNLMVSVDYQGRLNIWCLSEFKLLNSINLNTEAIFCEFIYKEHPKCEDSHEIFIILSDGTVKTVVFNRQTIIEQKDNRFMEGESIKSICITDGGRFVICGGWWPFFLIYDTQDLENVIVLEDFKIQTLCAAKNSLKFAAASENQIFCYTFYCEGPASTGNFNKKRIGDGYWKKHINLIDGDYFVEWLCFLPSFLIVAACTDNIIRIYEDDQLILAFQGESGTIYSHPTENIFAVVGNKLSIYQIISPDEFPDTPHTRFTTDENTCDISNTTASNPFINLIYSEDIYINLNDCQFGDDGKYFITCDDQGVIRAYSTESPVRVPEQQFFISDLDRTLSDVNFEETYNLYRQKNTEWKKIEYNPSSNTDRNRCIHIEKCAIISLDKLKMNENKFKRLYLSMTPEDNQQPEINNNSDNEETYIISDDSNTMGHAESLTVVSDESRSQHSRSTNRSESSTSDRTRKKRLHKLKGYKKKSKRKLVISESESNTSIKEKRKIVESEEESSPLIVTRKDNKVSEGIMTRNKLKKSDEQPTRVLRRSLGLLSINNDESSEEQPTRVLRRSLGLIPTVVEESSEEQPTRILRRSLGLPSTSIDESNNKISQTSNDSVTESIEKPNTNTNTRNSRKHRDNPNENFKNNRTILRRSMVLEDSNSFNEADSEENGIDRKFERELARFSYDWLSSCSIYEGVQVYFDLESYSEFMFLDQRIAYSKKYPKKSGIYTVTSVKYNFVGRIPYMILVLDNKFDVQFYEYPDSRGILCTIDQYMCNKSVEILYFDDSTICKGKIQEEDDRMGIVVNGKKMLKSMILIKASPLDARPIECTLVSKPLFGLSRSKRLQPKPIIDYNLINMKITNGLYRNEEELLFDLKYVCKIAHKLEEAQRNLADNIYTQYSNIFCKKTR